MTCTQTLGEIISGDSMTKKEPI